MKRRQDRPRRPRTGGTAAGRREWIGGVLAPPFYLLDREEPYRPKVVVWLELPEGRIVGRALVMPEDLDGAVGRVLRKALAEPLVGAPRRPDAIRVDDPLSAAEVRAETDGGIPVTLAPLPELDDVLDHMVESMPPGDADEGYLAGGRVSPATVERLFTAARGLFATAPWSIAADTQVLRMDVPALDVEGACLSILGQATGRHGVLIFPSLADFEAFIDAAGDRGARPHRRPRRDLTPLRHAPACSASVRRQEPTTAAVESRPHRPPAGPRCRQLPDSPLGGNRGRRRRGGRPAAPILQPGR